MEVLSNDLPFVVSLIKSVREPESYGTLIANRNKNVKCYLHKASNDGLKIQSEFTARKKKNSRNEISSEWLGLKYSFKK